MQTSISNCFEKIFVAYDIFVPESAESLSCFTLLYLLLGINIFLDGFVPTENLRFRETSLIFKVSETATEEEIKRLCCYDYPKMTKQLGKRLNFIYFYFMCCKYLLGFSSN